MDAEAIYHSNVPAVLEAVTNILDGIDPTALEQKLVERLNNLEPSEAIDDTECLTENDFDCIIDEADRYLQEGRYQFYIELPSLPVNQFRKQAVRELRRLAYQLEMQNQGRRQTLPHDSTINLERNAVNNVRQRWVDQGIWGAEWGPSWPRGIGDRQYSEAVFNDEELKWEWLGAQPPPHPFKGYGFNPNCFQEYPNHWGHEEVWGSAKDEDGESEDGESEDEESEDGESEDEESEDEESEDGENKDGDDTPFSPLTFKSMEFPDVGPPVKLVPTVDNASASFPKAQFRAQVVHERNWIRDEEAFKNPDKEMGVVCLIQRAVDVVRENWRNDGIWRPQWDEGDGIPFGCWAHEFSSFRQESAAANPPESPDREVHVSTEVVTEASVTTALSGKRKRKRDDDDESTDRTKKVATGI